ncbi:CUB and sushi domain-containing protein 3, partial [Araneus ventricosus]
MQYFLEVEKQRAICGDPGIPRDGSRLNPDGSDASDPRMFEEGESVIFSCNGESFALHGTSFITCLADGTWSAPRPRCINPPVVEGQRATCDDPGIPIGGSRLNPDGSNSSYPRMFEIGESVNYTCEGKYSILEGTSYITCLADGAWSELPPRCINLQVVDLKRATCIYPGIPKGRSRLYPVGSNAVRPLVFQMGESVIFTCSAESFALHGASFITCLADGTWSAPRPRCINPPV